MRPVITLLALACITVVGVASADVYRWVDEQGRVHFGDRPGGATAAEKLDLPEPVSTPRQQTDQQQLDAERRAARQRLLDAYQEEREAQQQAKREQDEMARKREQRCIYARNRLSEYENSGSLYQPLAGGERRYLSPAERRTEIEAARSAVERWCDE